MNIRIILATFVAVSLNASGPLTSAAVVSAIEDKKAKTPPQPLSTPAKIAVAQLRLEAIDKTWSDTILDQEATHDAIEKLVVQLQATVNQAQNRLAMRDAVPAAKTQISTSDLQGKDKTCQERGAKLAATITQLGARIGTDAADDRPIKYQAGKDQPTRSGQPITDVPLAANMQQANELYAKRVKDLEKQRHDTCVSLAKELIKEHSSAARIKLFFINRWA